VSSRRVVCTIAHGPHRALLDVTGPALQDYAARYGYDVQIVDRRIAPNRPASWEKIALLHELVQRHDLVFWIDADARVLPNAPDVVDVLAPRRFLHLVEHRVRSQRIPNAGVMVMRGGLRSKKFLERVWNDVNAVHHPWWDNAAIIGLLGYRMVPTVRPARPSAWRLGVGFLDNAWNSIPEAPAPSPFVVHFPGRPLAERLEGLASA